MFRSRSLRSLAAALCLVAATACGSNSSGDSSSPTSPSAPSVNLAGSWTGTFGSPQASGQPDNNPTRVVWTATQNGASVTGPFALTVTDDDEAHVFNGTMSGTLTGSQLALSLSFPAGVYPPVPTCSISGTGTSTPTSTSLTSTVTITFSAACVGTVSDGATETDLLTLAKQ